MVANSSTPQPSANVTIFTFLLLQPRQRPSHPRKCNKYGFYFLFATTVNAPEIGQNVVNHHSTFKSCTNLAGNITLINTSVTEANMTNMFYGCNASIPKTLRCPTGSLTYNSAINVVDGKNGVTVVAY